MTEVRHDFSRRSPRCFVHKARHVAITAACAPFIQSPQRQHCTLHWSCWPHYLFVLPVYDLFHEVSRFLRRPSVTTQDMHQCDLQLAPSLLTRLSDEWIRAGKWAVKLGREHDFDGFVQLSVVEKIQSTSDRRPRTRDTTLSYMAGMMVGCVAQR